jgi:hypothetical protein
MAFPDRLPTPPLEPATEKVRGGRRTAVAVLVGAVVVVGALLWKPWDAPSPAPLPTTVAVVPSRVAQPSATPFVFEPPPPATTAPVAVGPNVAAPAPSTAGHFAAVLLASDGPYVRCRYESGRNGQERLAALVVAPPIVTFGHGGKTDLVRTIVFRPELETNSLQGIFSSDWHFVAAARAQRWPFTRGSDIEFRQAGLKPHAADIVNAAVFRVSVVVNWIGDYGELLDSQRLYPASYASEGSATAVPDGCPALVTRTTTAAKLRPSIISV